MGRGSSKASSTGAPAGVTAEQRNRIHILQESARLQGSISDMRFRKESNGSVTITYRNNKSGQRRRGSINKNGRVTYYR